MCVLGGGGGRQFSPALPNPAPSPLPFDATLQHPDHIRHVMPDACFVEAERRAFGKGSWAMSFQQMSRTKGCSHKLSPLFALPASTKHTSDLAFPYFLSVQSPFHTTLIPPTRLFPTLKPRQASNLCVCARAHARALMCVYVRACARSRVYVCARERASARSRDGVCVSVRACVCVCVCVCVWTGDLFVFSSLRVHCCSGLPTHGRLDGVVVRCPFRERQTWIGTPLSPWCFFVHVE